MLEIKRNLDIFVGLNDESTYYCSREVRFVIDSCIEADACYGRSSTMLQALDFGCSQD